MRSILIVRCAVLTPQNSFVIKMFIKQKEMDEKLIVYFYLSIKIKAKIFQKCPRIILWFECVLNVSNETETKLIKFKCTTKSNHKCKQIKSEQTYSPSKQTELLWGAYADESRKTTADTVGHRTHPMKPKPAVFNGPKPISIISFLFWYLISLCIIFHYVCLSN